MVFDSKPSMSRSKSYKGSQKYTSIISDGLTKRGARCKKSKGGHYLVSQEKVAEVVLSI